MSGASKLYTTQNTPYPPSSAESSDETRCTENTCNMLLPRAIPSWMIFVPSIDGKSHTPDEATHPDDLLRGIQVLAEATLALAADVAHPAASQR